MMKNDTFTLMHTQPKPSLLYKTPNKKRSPEVNPNSLQKTLQQTTKPSNNLQHSALEEPITYNSALEEP